jgi:hypothetical protein
MSKEIIHSVADFVEVSYRPNLKAVYLKWFSEYDEGARVKEAVFAALNYVRKHNIQHWLADISTSRRGLTEEDQKWVSGDEFCDAIKNSPLRKFVLIPPLSETGQDVSWLVEWEANTLAKFGDRVEAKLLDNQNEIQSFFVA